MDIFKTKLSPRGTGFIYHIGVNHAPVKWHDYENLDILLYSSYSSAVIMKRFHPGISPPGQKADGRLTKIFRRIRRPPLALAEGVSPLLVLQELLHLELLKMIAPINSKFLRYHPHFRPE